jgi:Uma2 family endonuclease
LSKGRKAPKISKAFMTGSVLKPHQESEPSLRKLAIGEYHKLGEAGILHPNDRVELLDGLLMQMAPIRPEHQFILEKLNDIFSGQKRGRYKVGPGRPVPIPDFDEPQPDMVLFKTDAGVRSQHISPQEIYLVIEVSDTTLKFDSEEKRRACERAGIPEYWIVDIPAKTVRAFRLNRAARYEEARHQEGSIAGGR